MRQLIRIAHGAVLRQELFEPGARRQKTIGRMHRHDAMFDLVEERDGIEPPNERIRGIELHAEVGLIRQRVEQSEKGSSCCANSG